jgi:hypothetical protein
MVTQGTASWRDSDTEKALKHLLSFGKLNGSGEMVVHDGTNHMKLFQAMKNEFKVPMVILLYSIFYLRPRKQCPHEECYIKFILYDFCLYRYCAFFGEKSSIRSQQ